MARNALIYTRKNERLHTKTIKTDSISSIDRYNDMAGKGEDAVLKGWEK
jgi:hypothetical protein